MTWTTIILNAPLRPGLQNIAMFSKTCKTSMESIESMFYNIEDQ